MGQVRDVCSTLLSLRKAEGLRVRLPLAKAVVATPDAELHAPHLDILRDELNVKEIELTDDVDRFGRKELILNPKTLGPRLGGQTQEVIKAHKAGDWTIDAATARSWSVASSCNPTSTLPAGVGRRWRGRRRSRATTGSSCSTPRSRPSSSSRGAPAI